MGVAIKNNKLTGKSIGNLSKLPPTIDIHNNTKFSLSTNNPGVVEQLQYKILGSNDGWITYSTPITCTVPAVVAARTSLNKDKVVYGVLSCNNPSQSYLGFLPTDIDADNKTFTLYTGSVPQVITPYSMKPMTYGYAMSNVTSDNSKITIPDSKASTIKTVITVFYKPDNTTGVNHAGVKLSNSSTPDFGIGTNYKKEYGYICGSEVYSFERYLYDKPISGVHSLTFVDIGTNNCELYVGNQKVITTSHSSITEIQLGWESAIIGNTGIIATCMFPSQLTEKQISIVNAYIMHTANIPDSAIVM